MPLKGRLGLESANIPHEKRHGFIWLERGKLSAEDGNLTFDTAGSPRLESGSYDIPFQKLSCILMGPGGTVSHDALRLLARHNTALFATGTNGVRLYAKCLPGGPDRSDVARKQAELWGDESQRLDIAKTMFFMRLGRPFPGKDLNALRGIEGRRVKKLYDELSEEYGVEWSGRQYDRSNPEETDPINQAINHASTAVYAAAGIAVAMVGALPQLGFIHESSGRSFSLDIADLYRGEITLPVAFKSTRKLTNNPDRGIETITRKMAGNVLREESVISDMIDKIKEVLNVDDDSDNS